MYSRPVLGRAPLPLSRPLRTAIWRTRHQSAMQLTSGSAQATAQVVSSGLLAHPDAGRSTDDGRRVHPDGPNRNAELMH